MRDKVETAIINIFKEEGRMVKSFTEDQIVVEGFGEVVYNYKVKGDIITISRRGLIAYEKFISSYQGPFSFTINK